MSHVRVGGRPRRGFTLLEVLVSMGIIIAALAGIAALLPAAGSRLAEATEIDRAGTLAANARADLASRGLITSQLWTTSPAPNASAVVFGEGLTALGPPVALSGSFGATITLAGTAAVAARIDPATGFRLPDNLQTTASGEVTGSDPGVCYGCMLSSTAAPTGPGASVRLTTVVFRNPSPGVRQLALTQTGSGSSVFTSGSGAAAADDRKRFLAGCSWVLAVGTGEPRWIRVSSSWTGFPPGAAGAVLTSATGSSFVTFSGTDFVPLVSGSTLQVFGFEGLLRLDERFVNLE